MAIASVVVTRVADKSVLSKWVPAGDVRLQRARRRSTGQAVSATGGDVGA